MIELPPAIHQLLDAGLGLVVETRSRAAAVRLAYAWQRSQRETVWPSPLVSSVSGWQAALAALEAREGELSMRLPLQPLEEWVLWREAAERRLATHDSAQLFALSTDRLADLMAAAARLACEWGVSTPALSRDDRIEGRWLALSVAELRERARERGALPSFDLPEALLRGTLRTQHRHYLAGSLPRRIEALLQTKGLSAVQLPIASATKRVCVSVAADPLEELERAAEWARARLEVNPRARLYIVVPRLAHYRDAAARIFEQALTPHRLIDGRAETCIDIEGGLPLTGYAQPSAALRSLRLLAGTATTSEFAEWIESSVFNDLDLAARARIAAALRARAPRRVSMGEWQVLLQRLSLHSSVDEAVLQRLAERLSRAHRSLETAEQSSFSSRFALALDELKSPAVGAASSAVQQVSQEWQRFLEQFAACERWHRCRSVGEAVALLKAMAERHRFAPSQGEAAVTLTRALDHPVVKYDGIWVAGLQSDTWPAPQRFDAFLPWEMQRAAQIPLSSAAGQTRLAQAAMQRWASCSDELVYSCARADGETELQPSVLLRDLPPLDPSPCVSLAARLKKSSTTTLESISDEYGLPWSSEALLPGGGQALIDQDACAFRAYAHRRLLGRFEQDAEHGISALSRGSFMHHALQYLWAEIGDSRNLLRLDVAALMAILERALDDAAAVTLGGLTDDGVQVRSIERERNRARELIQLLLNDERTRPAFTVLLSEHALETQLGTARVSLRIDRVDQIVTADGRQALAVIDYKSGRHQSLAFGGERIEAIQLWLYAIALEAAAELPVVALGNLHLQSPTPRFAGLAAEEGLLPRVDATAAWESWREQARVRLLELAQAFQAGFAAVQPSPQSCEYCELSGLCRRGALLDGADERDSEQEEAS